MCFPLNFRVTITSIMFHNGNGHTQLFFILQKPTTAPSGLLSPITQQVATSIITARPNIYKSGIPSGFDSWVEVSIDIACRMFINLRYLRTIVALCSLRREHSLESLVYNTLGYKVLLQKFAPN